MRGSTTQLRSDSSAARFGLGGVESSSAAAAAAPVTAIAPAPPAAEADAQGNWALTQAAVERWAVTSRPHDRLVYARGRRLLRNAGVEAISTLHDEGEVILNYRKTGAAGGEWLATRRAEPERIPPPQRVLHRLAPEPDRDRVQRTLAVLKRVALAGRKCPTNEEIAKFADLPSADTAAYQLRKLISARLIRVDTDTTGFRVVTIVSTGRKTGGRL